MAFEALAKWYLNGWQDQIFCENNYFASKNSFTTGYYYLIFLRCFYVMTLFMLAFKIDNSKIGVILSYKKTNCSFFV